MKAKKKNQLKKRNIKEKNPSQHELNLLTRKI